MAPATITTVIPTYQRPRQLRAAIETALAQTYPHVKVLVCDNASGDETAEVVGEIQRRDPRVVYHCHKTNIGPMENYRFGVDAVDTKYFSIFADDDLLLPGFYQTAMAAFAEHPDAAWFCGQSVLYDESRGTHNVRPFRRWKDGFYEAGRWTRLMFQYYFAWTSCVLSADMREELGPINAISVSDILYLGQAAARFPFVVRMVPCSIFLITGTNAFVNVTIEDLRECDEVLQQECDSIPNVSERERAEIRAVLREGMRIYATDIIRAAIAAGDRTRLDEAAAYCRERGHLNFKRRLRVALAQGGALPLMKYLTRISVGYKRLRRNGWRKQSIEEIMTQYSSAEPTAHG